MKKQGKICMLAALLVLLMLLTTLVACDGNEPLETTTFTPEATTAEETTTGDSEPPAELIDSCTVNLINGTLENGASSHQYEKGSTVTLTAKIPPNGYRFVCWADANGETVGEEKTISVTVNGDVTYKAYYEVFFGDNDAGESIMTDLSKDWAQGGINGKFTAFNGTDSTRTSFATPYLLRKGETISVSLPIDTHITCPYATDDKADTVPCEGGCELTAARLILKKNEGSETGNILTDYTLVEKATWNASGFSYTAKEDVYVMITVKYNLHGAVAFSAESEAMKEVEIRHVFEKNDDVSTDEKAIGYYWVAEIENAVTKIEANRAAIGEGVSEFFYVTDPHWRDYNAHYSPALINYLAERLDEYHVVFGGDAVEYSDQLQDAIDGEIRSFFAAMTSYTKAGESLKIMATLGNHDRNYNLNSSQQDWNNILTDRQAYELYTKQMEGWGVTTDGNPYRSYYDDEENRVRYLQFYFPGAVLKNEEPLIDESLDWAEARVRELDSSWTVVLFSHGYFSDTSPKSPEIAKRLLNLQKEADAEIAIWITGHTHADRHEILVSEDGQSALRVISLNGDSYAKKGQYTLPMTLSTVTEQSLSFIQLDKANKKIYLTRFGAGEDLTFTYGEAMEGEYDATPSCQIYIVNGKVAGNNIATVKMGEEVALVALPAPDGYAFSCWKNSKGEIVGTTATLKLTVQSSETYRAYYDDIDPTDDQYVTGQILTNYATDWQQGGFNGTFTEWAFATSANYTSRVIFAEPILLKKGQTLTVTVPEVSCPTGGCADGCTLAVGYIILEKVGDSDVGAIPADYEIVEGKWKNTYKATKDTYIVFTIKYTKHGALAFDRLDDAMKDVVVTIK